MHCAALMCFRINVVFVDKDGKEQPVQAPLGKNMLEVAHDNEVELEGAVLLLQRSACSVLATCRTNHTFVNLLGGCRSL
jgi:hypothetical protein